MKPKAVVLHSGGLDSTTLLYHYLAAGFEVLPLAVNYNQRHRVELQAGELQMRALGLQRTVLDLPQLSSILQGSSQSDPSVAVPLGHYAEESMKLTVVPNRNMMLLSMATAFAVSQKAQVVAFANHAGDHTIYPDCRPEFVNAMRAAIRLCDWHTPRLEAPFTEMTKANIVTAGADLGVPFLHTWSCYAPHAVPGNFYSTTYSKEANAVAAGLGHIHCGRCGTCTERIEAFEHAGVEDPTPYNY